MACKECKRQEAIETSLFGEELCGDCADDIYAKAKDDHEATCQSDLCYALNHKYASR